MRKKSVIWIIAVSLLLLLLVSCSSTVKTDMSFTEEFFGERSIICTLDGSLGQNEIASVEGLIQENCPPELAYEVAEVHGKRVVTFTLAFASESEYRTKVASLVGREPQISLHRTNTIFCQGISYREDFTSQDLLSWFDKAAVQKNLIKEGQNIWKLEKPTLTFNGKQYTSTTDNMDVVDMISHPVDKIVVKTVLKADGSFQRLMEIHIPRKTVDTLGSSLTSYLATLSDEALTDTPTGKKFSLNVTAATPEELLEKTRSALDADKSTLTYEKDSGGNTKFIDQSIWNESLDFSAFLSSSGKVYVSYEFSVEEPSAFVSAKVMRLGEWVNAPEFEPALGFSQQGETDVVNVQFVIRRQQLAVTGVFIETNFVAGGSWDREIVVRFDGDKTADGPEKLKHYIEELGIDSVEAHTDKEGNPITQIHLGGPLPQLSKEMEKLFGEGNSLDGVDSRLFLLPQYSAKWTENIDMRGFLSDIGYVGRVDYTLNGRSSSANIQLETLTDTDGEKAEKEERQNVEMISFPSGEPVQIAVSVSVANPTGLVIIGILALALILFLVRLFLSLSNRYFKPDKAQKKLPASAGKEAEEVLLPRPVNAPHPDGQDFADVDHDAVTKTIVLEEEERQTRRQEVKTKKIRGRQDQYAVAKESLSETFIGPKRKSQSTKQYMKDGMKSEAAENAAFSVAVPVETSFVTTPVPTPAPSCLHCGEALRLGANFCTHCGKSAQVEKTAEPVRETDQICPTCNHEVNPQYTFCNKCGTRIKP